METVLMPVASHQRLSIYYQSIGKRVIPLHKNASPAGWVGEPCHVEIQYFQLTVSISADNNALKLVADPNQTLPQPRSLAWSLPPGLTFSFNLLKINDLLVFTLGIFPQKGS
ncbi:TPA: hypothetical protein OTT35_001799 [Citrobacter koseri]|nr:hypothetical protein [Citrobacter koseri]